MRGSLQAANTGLSPERAIEQLQRIQRHQASFPGGKPMTSVSNLAPEQDRVLHALGIEKPTLPEQLTLL